MNLASRRAFLNLHPGVLSAYRGVITAIRAMMKGEKEFGYSLHHINEKLDEGDIIDIRPPDYSKTMLANIESRYEVGVGMVMDAVENFARGGDLHEATI
jgi:methionyl-tRNA formyltransferase